MFPWLLGMPEQGKTRKSFLRREYYLQARVLLATDGL